jgi:hypothetical protein
MNITLKVDTERLTFGDLLALEDAQDGKHPFHGLGQIIARFIVDENDEFVDEAKGLELLKPLSMSQINEIAQQFSGAVAEAQKSAVPLSKKGS